jgi:parvin|uniref:Calponin-homology (CH) domain-containing protein n=1 Tax=Panagrolaimus sp. PS1159 TaxID=55785 RepID=A0AC35FVE3_9BILA
MPEYDSGTTGSRKQKKDEGGFLGKLGGTLTRKKKQGSVPPENNNPEDQQKTEEEEIEIVEREGRDAIDNHLQIRQPDLKLLADGQTIRILTQESRDDPKFREIVELVLYWVNDELASERIVVNNLQEDFYDGQVIQKLIEKLAEIKIEVPEVSQSEEGQKQKWRIIVDALNRNLLQSNVATPKWSAETIHNKDIVAILQLLIHLAIHYRAPIKFPQNVNVQLMTYTKQGKQVSKNLITEQLTTRQTELGQKGERDAFDTLFDYGPDKLQHVKSSLVAFCNKHLNKINLEITDLETQFQDGVFLILLMGLLEGYFVPLYKFHLQVTNNEEKLKNVQFAFFLMEEAGIPKPKSRAHDIVNGDLKSTLRVLHGLFSKYKHA